MQPYEKNLVRELQKGNSEALDKLYLTYGKDTYRFAPHIVRDKDDASDICHHTFITVREKLSAFDPENSFRVWLFSIVHSLSAQRIQKETPYKSFEQADKPSDYELANELMSDAVNAGDKGGR